MAGFSNHNFGYYMDSWRQFLKEQRQAEALSPKEYGIAIQGKHKKKKRGGKR